MKNLFLFYERCQWSLSTILKGIGNPHPSFASFILLGMMLSFNFITLFSGVGILFDIKVFDMLSIRPTMFGVVFFASLYLFHLYAFRKKRYSLPIFGLHRRNEKIKQYKFCIILWCVLSVCSIPFLGYVKYLSLIKS
ncbi:hypothetical protein C1E23_17275 [Pseudoalteromonas phenolica]|uniref:Uncharacterized protein n=1 Tax=Pseudoalteromonas phenolica TaxID=161398 RepID=A0A4Q7IK87_9GAMM|nr:hypothetical protein C1E23_17275 [Pseudoalteromonas phenolica]